MTSRADALELARSSSVARPAPGRTDGLRGARAQLGEDRDAKVAAAYAMLAEARAPCSGRLPVDCVSAAGTSTPKEALADPTITEVQAGVYALMEPELLDLGLPFHCAAVIRGTVISRHRDRFVVDIGRRAAGMEYGPPGQSRRRCGRHQGRRRAHDIVTRGVPHRPSVPRSISFPDKSHDVQPA